MASKWLQASVIAVLSLGLVVAGRADDKKPDAAKGLKFTSRVQADAVASLSARVAGAVAKVNVNYGDRVKQGQVLIELSAPELQADEDTARAKLQQAQAEVEKAGAAVQAARARLEQVNAGMHAAEGVYKRATAAAAAVPESVIDDAKNDVDKTKAGVDVAKAEVAEAEAGVKVAQAGAEIAKAGVSRAQARLEFTRILAPFDGVVSELTVGPGTTVAPPTQGVSEPLLIVLRDDVVRVYFNVDERDAAKVGVGAPVVIHVPALPDAVFQGKVTQTDAYLHGTGPVSACVVLPNPDGKLKLGMSVTVEVKSDK